MGSRPFMGQAAAPQQQELVPLACPTGPDTLDVIDANTGFVVYRNQPGRVDTHPECKRFGYTYDAKAPAVPQLPATPPAPAAAPAESIKWLGPTPGSPYKPFLSSYPPVNSTYTVAQGTPFNTPPNVINVATQPPPPETTPPPLAYIPAPAPAPGPDPATIVSIAAGVLALGVGAYFIFFGK